MIRRLPSTLLAAALLAFAVFTQGSRTSLEWTLWRLCLGLLSLGFWIRAGSTAVQPTERWLLGVAVLAPACVAAQLVPLPIVLVRMLSPTRAALAAGLGTVMPAPGAVPLTIDAAATVWHLLNLVACVLVFLFVREHVRSSGPHARWLAAIPLIFIGAAEAAFALAQQSAGADASGTYLNKNHLAGLLEMALPLGPAAAFAVFSSASDCRWLPGSRAVAAFVLLACSWLMLLGLAASGSKLGFVAGLGGLFAMGLLALTAQRGPLRIAGIVGLALACLVAVVALPTDQFVSAFGGLAQGGAGASEGRWPIWQDAVSLLKAFPLTGSGLGTFGLAFLRYQTALVDVEFAYAHNDYLQLASELGLVGFAIVLGGMAAVLMRALRSAVEGVDRPARALALGCAGSLVAIAIHSLGDFNMYVPANAIVLAWISGIAVGLPRTGSLSQPVFRHPMLRASVVVLAGALVVYSSASYLEASVFPDDVRAERSFCRLGLCETDRVVALQGRDIPSLLEALRRQNSAPYRWSDLGEAYAKAGQLDRARQCVETAVRLGPHVPSILLRAAQFDHALGEEREALALTSRILLETDASDQMVLNWYYVARIPPSVVVAHGLPPVSRPAQAYLRYLMSKGEIGDAGIVWSWLLDRHYADPRLAREYVAFLHDSNQDERAASAWARYVGARGDGYPDPNRVYNGGFESDPSGSLFDWRLEGLGDDVKASIDPKAAHAGRRSLRLEFGGQRNVSYADTAQTVFATPGTYRFEAFVRTDRLTTDQGIRFHIGGEGVNVTTGQVTGTTGGWTAIEADVLVPPPATLLTIYVARDKSLKFDSNVAGTVWIDDVSLTKVQ